MLVHFKVVKDGQPTHERVANENEAQRVFGKAMEKGAVFIACHQGTEMPEYIDAKAHADAVAAAKKSSSKATEAALKDAYDQGHAAALAEYEAAMNAAEAEPATPIKRGPGRPRKSTEE
jgi:succinate dehydrogenase/fumarate reductase-like Fe-S protein